MESTCLRLVGIPTGVISLPHQERRRNSALKSLRDGGIVESIIDGVRDTPRYRGCSKGHLAALRKMQGQEPFLVLEDDVILTEHFSLDVRLPSDCALLYLGHSNYGTDAEFQGLGQNSDLTELTESGLLRVHSMLAAHAILYVDPAAVEAVAKSIEASISGAGLRRHDLGLCELQQDLRVYASAQPYFAQNEAVQGKVKKTLRRDQRNLVSKPRFAGQFGSFGTPSLPTHCVKRTTSGRLRWEPIQAEYNDADGLLGFVGPEIFSEADTMDRAPDLQGWNSKHILFRKVIEAVKPETIIEVGVWKGASVIHMAQIAAALNLSTRIIAVDTWLGSSEHWLNDELRAELCLRNGYPTLFETFLVNVRNAGFDRVIEPLPVPSSTAAHILRERNITADLIHIDAGHEFEDVWADLKNYAPMLSDGGVLIGDDYTRSYRGVKQAFNKYCRQNDMTLRKVGRKCVCAKHDVFKAKVAPIL